MGSAARVPASSARIAGGHERCRSLTVEANADADRDEGWYYGQADVKAGRAVERQRLQWRQPMALKRDPALVLPSDQPSRSVSHGQPALDAGGPSATKSRPPSQHEPPMMFAGLPPTGSLQREWRRCGKRRCRCTRGMPHGPYWYLRWRERGRQRRQYVPRERVDAIRVVLEQRRRLRPPVWSLRQALADLRQLTKEIHDGRHDR
jgi:hypothetical protein